MQNLEKAGIKTVISLRAFHDSDDEVAGTHLNSQRIPIYTWAPGMDKDDRLLKILEDCPKPALVNCLHGSDRTGAMVAIYRIREQGWSPEEAITEMKSGGTGFHRIWRNLPGYVERETANVTQ